jgi:hypothetical protein
MWAAHGIAMVLTIAFLRRAEVALWSLVRDAVAAAARRLPGIATRPTVSRAAFATEPRHPVSSVVVSALRDRGPPTLAGV